MTPEEGRALIARYTRKISEIEDGTEPVISVCIPTFNHAPFIAEALETTLNQQVAYAYEVVIGDDCSTDGTTEILSAYQRRRPNRIRLLLATDNLGKYTGNGRLNLIRTWGAAGASISRCSREMTTGHAMTSFNFRLAS